MVEAPMSFLTREKAGGKPIELYVFQRGTEYWRYTDDRSAVTVNGLAYQPATISRSAQTDSQEESQSTVTVTLDHALPVVAGMLSGPADYRIASLAIFRYQPGSTDKALVARGRLSSVRWRGASVEVTLTQMGALLQLPVLRKTYLPTCNHMVYDEYCQKDPADFTFSGTVAAIFAKGAAGGSPDGPSFTVTVSGAPAEFGTATYFAAGFFTFDGQPTYLIAHTVETGVALLVALDTIPAGIAVGTVLPCTAGCDGAYATCLSKFNNLANYFGFPFMPTKNVYTQGLR
jgi:uncharacterized phage protein (TIGR02218 family)